MLQVTAASQAAPDAARNEDFALVTPDFIVVLDGVTVVPGMQTGCRHGPAWYVRRLASHLLLGHTATPDQPLPDLLAAAIRATREDHPGCDLDHPDSPQSTVCLLRVRDHRAEYLVLSDSPLVLDHGGEVEVVRDLRHRSAGAAPSGSSTGEATRLERVLAKRRYANQPGGYWVAAAEPDAAYQAITGEVPVSELTRAALLTDGASCAVDYGLLSWPALLDLVARRGPDQLIAQVRAVEHSDPERIHRHRYKRYDDATVVFCRPL